MKILVLNAGSSSHKIRLYEVDTRHEHADVAPAPLWSADADWGQDARQVAVTLSTPGKRVKSELPTGSQEDILSQLLTRLWQGELAVVEQPGEIAAVGHRVVHGGAQYRQSTLITAEVRENLRQLIPFAPLHQPANLAGMEVVERLLGTVPQVAVFDTAFHSQMPEVARIYPGPYHWFEEGIQRYGFHGISHQYCSRRSAQLIGADLAQLRVVTCHLGNGSSLAAIRGGHSIDTTMGFTPLEGLMMGTRSGSLDPSILLYLQREQGLTSPELEHILNYESGLKGISGISADMRALLAELEQGNERAKLALDLFVYRLRSCLGSMIAALEGLDVLTFTGGIGEHVPVIRARLCQSLAFLGLELDKEKNSQASEDQEISAAGSRVRVLVIHTEEDWEIARSCWQLITPVPAQ